MKDPLLLIASAKLWAAYLGLFCLIGSLVFIVQRKGKGLQASPLDCLKFCFPKSIYFHRSTRRELSTLLVTKLIALFAGICAFPFGAIEGWMYQRSSQLLESVLGPAALEPTANSLLSKALYSLLVIVSFDLGWFVSHYLFHRVPALWKFHEFHHSASVLSPLSTFRFHPVEILVFQSIIGLVEGILLSLFTYLTGAAPEMFVVLGLNVVLVAFSVFNSFRHSHIWIRFGALDYVFISPAGHQIHHSVEPRHWNRNFGLNLAIWDWLARTLYVPKGREEFRVGLPNKPDDSWNAQPLWRCYTQPFTELGMELGRQTNHFWAAVRNLRLKGTDLRSKDL